MSGFSSATEGVKTVTVTYQGKTATFTVTVNDVVTIHYYNYADWTKVYAHYWYNNGTSDVGTKWPGVLMEREGTTKWWYIIVDADYKNILFNNSTDGISEPTYKTDDATIDVNNTFYVLGKWYNTKTPTINSDTVVIKDQAGWRSDGAVISVYAYGSSGNSWIKANRIAEDIYVVDLAKRTFTGNITGIIVVRNSSDNLSWDTKYNQTADITSGYAGKLLTLTGWDGHTPSKSTITIS